MDQIFTKNPEDINFTEVPIPHAVDRLQRTVIGCLHVRDKSFEPPLEIFCEGARHPYRMQALPAVIVVRVALVHINVFVAEPQA